MSTKLKFLAFADLLKRYGLIFRHAWRERHSLASSDLNRIEAQFLPAALSLQETPVSPAPRVAMWLLIGFALLLLLWAVFGKIDIVATAPGKIVPNDRTKTIQPLEPATVSAIHVRDGQKVHAGELLVELDASVTHADKTRITSELQTASLQVARARGMLHALDTGSAPKPVAPARTADIPLLESTRLLESQYAEYRAKQIQIDSEIAQKEAELRSTAALVRKLEQTLPIAQKRADDYKELVGQNFVSKHGYLEREQTRIEQEADLANQRSRMKEIEAALRATQDQKAALHTQTRRAHLDLLNEGLQKVASAEQELQKANTRDRQTLLRAPVDGTVQQLAVHTVGGVVTEAQPLMLIVPTEDAVEIEAMVENKDIGFVRPGQAAEIKVETFQYSKYGTIPAKIVSVSNDAINDEKRGLIYAARAKMERTTLKVDGREVHLSPGMALQVEIKTGRRRVIEYFLSPFVEYASESLKER